MTHMQFLKGKMDQEKEHNIALLEQQHKEGQAFAEDFAKFFKHEIEWNKIVENRGQETDEFIKKRNEIINAYGDLKKKLEDSYYILDASNVEEYRDMVVMRVRSVIADHFGIEPFGFAQDTLPVDADELDFVELLDELSEEFGIDMSEENISSGITVSDYVDMVARKIK